METATFDAIMASLEEVKQRYLNATGTAPHPERIRSWKPEDSGWRRFQALMDLVPGIRAERDQVVDVSCAHHYGALLPDAKIRVLRGIGHLPMLEAPLKSARIMREFWRNVE